MHRLLTAAVLASLLVTPFAARAKQPPAGTLTLEGASLAGVPVTAYSFGVTSTFESGSGGGGGAGKATLSPVAITRTADAASPRLMVAVASGQHFPRAVIVVANEGTALTITLEDVILTGFQQSGTSEVTETVSLSFRKITLTSGGTTGSWNVVENRTE